MHLVLSVAIPTWRSVAMATQPGWSSSSHLLDGSQFFFFQGREDFTLESLAPDTFYTIYLDGTSRDWNKWTPVCFPHYYLAQFPPGLICIKGACLCPPAINLALENQHDFTEALSLVLGLLPEERQFSWWAEDPASSTAMVIAALD